MLFFLLLLALPFASINAGVSFLAGRNMAWANRSLENNARRELEALTNSAASKQHLERSAVALRSLISRNGMTPPGVPAAERAAVLGSEISRLFGKHPPAFDLWLFEDDAAAPGDRPPRVLIASSTLKTPPRAVATAFTCLAHYSLHSRLTPAAVRRGEKLISSLFGIGQDASHLALFQRGIVTQVIHDHSEALLIWDGIMLPDGRRRGFFLIFRDRSSVEGFGLRAALRSHHRRGSSFAGFVRTLRSDVPDIVSEQLVRSESFSRWRKSLRPHFQLPEWIVRGTPWDIRLDEGRLFTRHLSDGRHMAVLMVPKTPDVRMPLPVFLLNLLVCGGALLFVTRGMLLGAWPVLPFGIRFSALFSLSALLPISLLLFGSLAFISESANSERNALTTRIRSALEGIDSARERLSGSFQAAFLKMLQHPQFRDQISDHGFDAPGLLDLINSHFRDEKGKNQLMFFALMDSQGKMKIFPSKGYSVEDLEGALRFSRAGLLQALRNHRVSQAGPDSIGPDPITDEDKAILTGYGGTTGNSLVSEIEQKLAVPFDFQVGRKNANLLFDFLPVGGIDTYAVIVAWNADDLAGSIIRNSMLEAQLRIPGAVLAAYRYRHGRLMKFTPASRHETTELLQGLHAAASTAVQRNGPSIEITPKMTRVAVPSRGFPGIILAATADTQGILADESMNQLLVEMLVICCMMLVLLAGRITARRMLQPIQTLREALEKVGRGDLSVCITDPRPDELGRLSVAFGTMVTGLRERRRLASLVSDQAIATLESAADTETALSAGSLDGVILISDIRGFTPLCETQPPAEITELLKRHFAEMAPIIASAGGRIDKFIGDAVQALFIEIQGREPAVIRAIQAGQAMLKALKSINREREAAGLFTYQAGIGIAGGRLLSGAIGHPSTRLDFALLGPSIARAAELEALSKLVPEHPIAVDAGLERGLRPYAIKTRAIPGHEDSALAIIISDNIPEPGASLSAPAVSSEEKTPLIPALDVELPIQVENHPGSGRSQAVTFTLGLLFLVLPFVSFSIATNPRLNGNLDRTVRETLEAHETAMMKLRVTNPVIHLLEDRLEQMCDRLSDVFRRSDPETGGQVRKKACSDAMAKLAKLDFSPSLAAVLYHPPNRPPASWPLAWCVGTDTTTTAQYLHDFLANQVCVFEGIRGRDWPDLDTGIPALVGKNIRMGPLESNFINLAMPSTRNGKNCWFYWRPLLMPTIIREADIATSAAILSPTTNRHRKVVGAMLVILPRRPHEEFSLKTLLNLVSSPVMELRITSVPSQDAALESETVISSGYPLDISDSSSGLVESSRGQYVISRTEAIISGKLLRLVLATRIAPPAANFSHRLRIHMVMIILYLLFAWVWYQTIFLRKGLATSLYSQLLTGFLAAALLPFSAILAGTARFTAEDIHTRMRTERFDLAQQLDEIDRLHLLQYPFVWDRIERVTKHPNLLKAIRQFQKPRSRPHSPAEPVQKFPSSAGADRPLVKMLEAIKQASKRGNSIYYITQIILSAPNGWKFELDDQLAGAQGTNIFSFYIAGIAHLLFSSVGDMPAKSGTEVPLGDAVKWEMGIETGFSILRSIFIPEISYRTLYSTTAHILFPGGNGVLGMSNILLPDVLRPRGFVSIIYNASNLEMMALNKIIQGNLGRFALFGCQLQHCGTAIRPDLGGALPQIAGPARWIQAGNMPMSFRIENGSSSFLVETRPGVLNPRIFIGAAAGEAPLLAATRQVQTGLLLWLGAGILATLLLAWRSAFDLIAPIRGLEAGMKELAAGKFETRIGTYRGDEIGDLQRSFDRMARSLQERELIRTMMSSQARKSAEIADPADGATEEAAGERIEALIAMTGIPGFQRFMQTMPPAELFQALTTQTVFLCNLFIEAGGDVDKVIGEKMLIVFRGKSLEECASRLFRALHRLPGNAGPCGLPFPVSVGISAGHVISGFIGSGTKRDHTVIGDTVNTAARLLGHAGSLPGLPRIVFSASCRALLPAGESCEHLGTVSVKGKSEPLAVYRLLPFERGSDQS